jgi:type III secretion system FlhB-like substrate exporter
MKRAVALRYDSSSAGADAPGAPIVISSGEGHFAERIERAARDYGVPVVRDVSLACALAALAEGDAIPESLYEPVAAILVALGRGGSP